MSQHVESSPGVSAAEPAKPSGRVFVGLLVVAVVGLGVLVILLTRTNRHLREQLIVVEQALARERTRDALATGDALSPITAVGADGAPVTLTFRGPRPTVVFLIAGKCPYCEQTIPVWQEVIAATRATEAGKVDLVTLQTDARRAADLKPLSGGLTPRLVPEQAGTWLLRVPISPGAMLVDTSGVVRRVWFGMPSERDREELVQALLGVLPER